MKRFYFSGLCSGRWKKGSSQASPHHTVLQPRRGAFGSSGVVPPAFLFPCPPLSEEVLGSQSVGSSQWGRELAARWPHLMAGRPWHRRNRPGSWGCAYFPIYSLFWRLLPSSARGPRQGDPGKGKSSPQVRCVVSGCPRATRLHYRSGQSLEHRVHRQCP